MWHRSFDQASQLRSGIFSIGFIPIDHASFFLQLIFCDHMIGLHCVVHGASICWSRSYAVLPFVEAGSNSASALFPVKSGDWVVCCFDMYSQELTCTDKVEAMRHSDCASLPCEKRKLDDRCILLLEAAYIGTMSLCTCIQAYSCVCWDVDKLH